MTIVMAYFSKHFIINIFCCLGFFLLSWGDETNHNGLPFCDLAESSNRFIFVSTLDGKLTALNPNNKGSVLWTLHPGSETLLSSSIDKLELSSYGHFVRMIPSLNGGLYKFNGESVELIPVTFDHLLQSSFKYSNDLVISGGKEIHTFGVSLRSGNIIYECSMKGCGNISHSTNVEEVLIIQRWGQIVRAVEPRTGLERWNFSVAQHDLKLLSECHSPESMEVTYNLKLVPPEGVIYATDVKDPKTVLWKHKFSSPVVSAWHLNQGKLVQLDMFSSKVSNFDSVAPPSIYIGMHEKQLYIQESDFMLKKREEIISKIKQNLITFEKNYPVIPWKPIPIKEKVLGISWESQREPENALDERQTTALSVLYASPYVDGNGFFLHSEDDTSDYSENTKKLKKSIMIHSEPVHKTENSFKLVCESLRYYWIELSIIMTTTFIIFNLMTYKRRNLKKSSDDLNKNDADQFIIHKENIQEIGSVEKKLDEMSNENLVLNYKSRYLEDFDPVACLGKGGFGVVFEAKNKIDDCHYAIKRILLPNKEESRNRVMREVKALAKLDHHHIVRYFNAWTECPPVGWQEKHDKKWLDMHSDIFTSGIPSAPTSSEFIVSGNPSSVSYLPASNLKNTYSEQKIHTTESSDSFIVFGEYTKNSETVTQTVDSVLTISPTTEESISSKMENIKDLKPSRPKTLQLSTGFDSTQFQKVYLYIQMQLCQRHSLRDWLMNNKKRDYSQVLSIFEQILQAVEHVHLHGLIHRDLKPSNIFFSLDNQIKVGDFGLVTAMTEEDVQMTPVGNSRSISNDIHTAKVGTQLYMSQEQLQGKLYNYKVDIYSLGLILYELLVSFSTQMERIKVLQNVKRGNFPESFKDKYKKEYELLKLMLSDSPDERPTTYGVRAMLLLNQDSVEENWHFELPSRRRDSSKTSVSTSSNEESTES